MQWAAACAATPRASKLSVWVFSFQLGFSAELRGGPFIRGHVYSCILCDARLVAFA